jgi:mycothione reductase
MEEFDILIIGSGSGMLVASAAVEAGTRLRWLRVAEMGGTCINVGCVPSKMLIHPADLIKALWKQRSSASKHR